MPNCISINLLLKLSKCVKLGFMAFLLSCLFSQNLYANSQLHYEKALSSFKAERFDESMIHLKNALQASPDSLPAKTLMGELLAKLGQYRAAEVEFSEALMQGADVSLFANAWGTTLFKLKEFEKIIKFDQFDTFSKRQNVNWQRLRSAACMQVKDYACARQSFKLIGEQGSYKAEELNGLANIQISLKDYEKADQLLRQALENDAENAITWQLRGIVSRNQNKLTAALGYLEKAFELDPNDPYILRNLADVYLASNNIQAAKETINSILDASPNDPFAILVNSWIQQDTKLAAEAEAKFIELANRLNSFPSELIEQDQSLLFLRALVAYRQQDFEKAMRDFIKLRKLDDSDISPIILLAKSYIVLGKEKDAIELLEQNQSSLLSLPDIMVMLGDLYINQSKNFKALTLLEDLQKDHPKNVQVRLLETKLLFARQKNQQGLALLDLLLKEYPTSETVLFVHAVLNLQAQNFVAADKSISQLVQLRPNDATKLNIKGAVLIKLNQPEAAREYIQKALSINPILLSAKYNLATTYFLQDDNRNTMLHLDDILQQSPRYTAALLLQAKLFFKDKALDIALEKYRLVLTADKQNIEALEGLVSVYIAQNDLDSALFQLTRLNKLQQVNPRYVIQKAQIYLTLQDQENTQNELRLLKVIAKDDAALLMAYSKLQLRAENVAEAIEALKNAQLIQPKAINIGIQLAEVLLNNDLTADAQRQIAVLTKRFSAHPTVTFLQGRLAEQQGDIGRANQFYQQTLALDDNYELALAKMYTLTTKGLPVQSFKKQIDSIISAYPSRYFPKNLLAQYYFYNNQLDLAAAQYEELLTHPDIKNKASLLSRLATIYMQSDLPKSANYANQAYLLDGTNANILATYGWVLTQQGQPTDGLAMLRKAYSRSPQYPAIQYYIAVSLDKIGLVAEAKSELENLFKKGQKFNELDKAQALYEKLSKS